MLLYVLNYIAIMYCKYTYINLIFYCAIEIQTNNILIYALSHYLRSQILPPHISGNCHESRKSGKGYIR